MALNIHTDRKFEQVLAWLARQSQKTKTDLIKTLVWERYLQKKSGFKFGSLRGRDHPSSRDIQKSLKELDADHDLD